MTDLSWTQAVAGLSDFVYSDSQGILYITTTGGNLLRFDVASQTFLSPVSLGGTLTSVDLTPDGSELLVAHKESTVLNGANHTEIDRISTSTLAVTREDVALPSGEYSAANLAIAADDTTLLSTSDGGSGSTPIDIFSATADPITIQKGMNFYDNSFLIDSADHRYILDVQGGISGSPFEVYDSTTHSFLGQSNPYSVQSYSFSSGIDAISSAAGLVATHTGNGEDYIWNLSGGLVLKLATVLPGAAIGALQFTPDGHYLLADDVAAGQMRMIDTTSWTVTQSFALSFDEGQLYGSAAAQAISADSRFLFLDTETGFQVVDLQAKLGGGGSSGGPANTLDGTSGNDVLEGHAGGDTLNGNAGDDLLFAADEPTNLTYPYTNIDPSQLDNGTDVDSLYGGDGDDRIYAGYGDNVYGGDGGQSTGDELFISFQGASSGVVADFSQPTLTIGGGTIAGIENVAMVEGSNFADQIDLQSPNQNGYLTSQVAYGMAGDDTIVGGYYTTAMYGGDGADSLDARASQYYLQGIYGGAGDDIIHTLSTSGVTYGGDGADTIYGGQQVYGDAGDDTIALTSVATARGGDGNDIITADPNSSANLFGGAGADTLTGSSSSDHIYSGDVGDGLTPIPDMGLEHDVLSAGGGDDALAAGYGDDVDGGGGNDTLNLSLGGAPAGVTLDLAQITGGSPYTLAGGTIQNVEAVATLLGSAFDDVLTGDSGDNVIEGGPGNDTLNGGGGTNTASYANAGSAVHVSLASSSPQDTGGEGVDTLSNFQNLTGSAYDDVLEGNAGNNIIDGGDGNDTVSFADASGPVTARTSQPYYDGSASGADGADTLKSVENLIGSSYDDTLTAPAGGVLEGGPGNDTLVGGFYATTVSYAHATAAVTVSLAASGPQDTGGAGTDTLTNITNLIGSNFDDTLSGQDGVANVLNGGNGSDTVSYAASGSQVWVDLAAGIFGGDTFISIENLTGSAYNDILGGDAGDNVLNGGAGVDTVTYYGATTGVTVSLAAVGPQNTGGAGADTLINFENLDGSAFNDTLQGDGGDNILNGNSGVNTVSYSAAAAGVTVDLGISGPQDTRGAGHDTLSNFQNLTGSAFDDVLSGNSGNNVLDGGAGIDTVSYASAASGVTVSLAVAFAQATGGGGVDTLHNFENLTGSAYNDVLAGNSGDNVLDGGAGVDTASYAGAAAGVTVSLSATGAQNTGGAGTDTVSNFENLTGSAYDDTLVGTAGANVLTGGQGSDVLYGLAGDDILYGGSETSNRDFLYGGAGNDTYYVNSSYASGVEDLVYEGGTNPDLMAGANDVDTIHSQGDFFWDYYSVGENLIMDAPGLLVGGKDVMNKTITGSSGDDRIVTYGHNSVVDAGPGTDAIDFGPYDLDSSYAGHNTLIMKPGSGIDYIYNFHSGTDKVDLSAFNFGIDGAYLLAHGVVNVDNPGTANDYCYFYLTGAGGVDNYVVFMGLLSSGLQASDFIT